MRLLGRAVVVSAVAVFAVAGAAIVTAPAAYAVTCTHGGNIWYATGVLNAAAWQDCREPNGETITTSDPVDILRLDPNTGKWNPLLSTAGPAAYHCVGTATNSYRLDNGFVNKEIDAVPCG